MSWTVLKRLKEESGQLLADLKVMTQKAEDEKRDLTAEEMTQFETMTASVETKRSQIEKIEKVAAIDSATTTQTETRTLPGRHDVTPEEQRSEFGFTQKDLKGYSLVRAIRARMNGLPLDGLEKEVSDEIATRSGKQPQGFFFPTDIAIAGLQQRALDLTAGAGAKPTVTDAANFIELLRNKTVCTQLGARVLPGLTGDLSIPKQTGGATGYWVTEGNSPTGSNQTIGQVGLAPKTVGAYTDLSRKFLIQSALSADQFVQDDLARVLAIMIDAAALNGSGTGAEPKGILQDNSVTTVAMGATGDVPTFAKLVELETTVAAANADLGNLAYVTNSKVRGVLKTTTESANAGAQFVWRNDTVNGYRAVATNIVPSNLTKGAGTNLSAAIFGNWQDLVLGFWSALDILVDPFTGSSSGTVRVVALQDCDVKLRHSESFAKIVDLVA